MCEATAAKPWQEVIMLMKMFVMVVVMTGDALYARLRGAGLYGGNLSVLSGG